MSRSRGFFSLQVHYECKVLMTFLQGKLCHLQMTFLYMLRARQSLAMAINNIVHGTAIFAGKLTLDGEQS